AAVSAEPLPCRAIAGLLHGEPGPAAGAAAGVRVHGQWQPARLPRPQAGEEGHGLGDARRRGARRGEGGGVPARGGGAADPPPRHQVHQHPARRQVQGEDHRPWHGQVPDERRRDELLELAGADAGHVRVLRAGVRHRGEGVAQVGRVQLRRGHPGAHHGAAADPPPPPAGGGGGEPGPVGGAAAARQPAGGGGAAGPGAAGAVPAGGDADHGAPGAGVPAVGARVASHHERGRPDPRHHRSFLPQARRRRHLGHPHREKQQRRRHDAQH
ncbi:Os02g0110600, partial [Oryza sativa Japonica Group]